MRRSVSVAIFPGGHLGSNLQIGYTLYLRTNCNQIESMSWGKNLQFVVSILAEQIVVLQKVK
jgi:hypothetical protein